MTSQVSAGMRPHAGAVPRLLLLHLISRRVPAALLGLVVCGLALGLTEKLRWVPSSGLVAHLVPLAIEAAAAVLVAASVHSPIGEPEKGTGQRIAYLRGTAILLTGATAVVALVLAATGTTLPGGGLGVARDTAGLIGIALLCAAAFGDSFCWTGPLAYLIVAQEAINAGWTTPWVWPARPAHDRGAALCAVLIVLAGAVIVTCLGTREPKGD